ncbi:hypothetical protein [Terrisporobacter mayombei]|uniref:Lipoprotein n=1 Tax=Terrisporobacter mayombei TaxID=1541 RepID=A0ABY9Q3Q6_9FIRM|nr:hypothetical protein [Terrisporobacter mayombei]MCC3866973.1 hypothetical protein [Terrisporobacter mayombei]WMT81222.1 hypothetical protein TEMA_15560 [Terrisporobacter mayombei]
MKKILSLGLFIIICCGFMVGCKSEMSEDDVINESKNIENVEMELYALTDKIDEKVESIHEAKNQLDSEKYYKELCELKKQFDECKKKQDKLNIDGVKEYYRNLYDKGNDDAGLQFEYAKDSQKSIKKYISLYTEIFTYFDDDVLTYDEYCHALDIQLITRRLDFYKSDDEDNKEEYKFQEELKKKYDLNYEEVELND